MRIKLSMVLLLTALAATSLSAHATVSPLQSKTGAVQKYELRVHNEGKVAATSIDLEIPDGVTVTEVAKPGAGAFTTKTTGDQRQNVRRRSQENGRQDVGSRLHDRVREGRLTICARGGRQGLPVDESRRRAFGRMPVTR